MLTSDSKSQTGTDVFGLCPVSYQIGNPQTHVVYLSADLAYWYYIVFDIGIFARYKRSTPSGPCTPGLFYQFLIYAQKSMLIQKIM